MSYRKMSPEAFDALTREYFRKVTLSRRVFLGGAAAMTAAAGFGIPGMALAQEGGTLRVGRADEPDSLDPHKTTLTVSSSTMNLIYEPLARRGMQGEVLPALAESWSFTNENRTLIFKLKPGALFHDGTPCDAEAVAWTVARHLDPENASPSAFFLGPLEGAEVIDPVTVAYHFTDPFVPVWVGLTVSYTAPISRAAVEKSGALYNREPVGAGPFRLASWSTDRGLRLERNAEYGAVDTPTKLNAVEFFHYPEDATRVAAFETGEIDAIYHGDAVPLESLRRLRDNPDANILSRPAQASRALMFNVSKAPLDNLLVRQAICHAIDTESLIAFALDGNAVSATSPVASAIGGYSPATAELNYAYDPARARELLAGAGYADGLSLTLVASDTSPIRRSAEVIQAQLAEVGIEVSITVLPIAQWISDTTNAQHDLALAYYSYSDADVVFPLLHSTGSIERTFHGNAELDALIEKQRVTVDVDDRQAILDEIQAVVVTEAYWKPLFEPLNFAVVSSKVSGAEMMVTGDLAAQTIALG